MNMIPEIKLSNGIKIPVLGLGVYKTTDPDDMHEAVFAALDAGYRLFDTAELYENEALLGKELLRYGADRNSLFITSKLLMDHMSYDGAIRAFEQTIKDLCTDHLDMFLIHWPGQKKDRLLETWRALEDLYKDGRIKALGMSNFTIKHIDWILESCDVAPVINQVEHHPGLSEPELYDLCKKQHIMIQSWSPLMRGQLDAPPIMAAALKHKKTPAQIVLRWHIQEGFLVIPKSVHRDRIFENCDIFDFELTEDELRSIDGLNTGRSISHTRLPATYDF